LPIAVICACWSAAASATPIVTLSLTSPSNGLSVQPGQRIDWTITAAVASTENLGLALLTVDLVQDRANPALLNLTPGQRPPELDNFDRPAGISNAGPGGVGSGFGGTPLGPDGQRNLAQIGGAQNTFGVPGTGLGESVDPDAGIGQGPLPQIIAAGSIIAPSATGVYRFRLTNADVNVLASIATPPAHSTVIKPIIQIASEIKIVVSPSDCVGDIDGDNEVTLADLGILLAHFGTPAGATPADGDLDGDGDVDLADLAIVLSSFGTICD